MFNNRNQVIKVNQGTKECGMIMIHGSITIKFIYPFWIYLMNIKQGLNVLIPQKIQPRIFNLIFFSFLITNETAI